MDSPPAVESMIERLDARATACADRLHEASSVLITSHIDADGLTSAAVAAAALERAGIETQTTFENQLGEDILERIAARDAETVLFTDFGSGQLDQIAECEQAGDFTPVIADHHQPADADTKFHLNPLLEGIDGASELSGAGAAYVLARALETDNENEERDDQHNDNRDLAALAIVGAVGDRQLRDGKLVGANQQIVAEGVEAGVLHERTDITFYGKQTRPLPKLLEYADDVHIPGITGNEEEAITFLSALDSDTELDLRDGATWQRWVDLPRVQQQKLMSAIVQHAIKRGVSHEVIDRLIGTSYLLPKEPEGTELRDASEFSTLLNSTARYDRAEIGFAICRGDRDIALHHARELRSNHKRRLSEGLELVKREGVTHEEHVQWFDAGERIRDTIVGIVAGMALGSEGINADRPIIAFATKTDADATSTGGSESGDSPERKVSARGTSQLVQQGLDLSIVMREAAEAVDGGGGGHDVAAGATIPAGCEASFIESADQLVAEQLR
jgi:single-stranded-DNA-specific exonuclease